MSPRPSEESPWPAQTASPDAGPSSDRKRKRTSGSLRSRRPTKIPRQTISDQSAIDQAKAQCMNSGNSVISCWPTESTVVVQDEWTQFVWNSQRPDFSQLGLVDIFLVRSDSGEQLLHFHDVPNPFGRAGAWQMQANDTWWANGTWKGQNISYPFNFVIVETGKDIGEGTPQATFTAVQTTFADSVIASMSSTSAAAASSASAASASLASRTSPPGGTGTNGLQNASSDATFPHWAIAVIVILGFFALLAFIVYTFWTVRWLRRRRDAVSRRASMGSQSPMMANAGAAAVTSPQIPSSTLVGVGAGAATGSGINRAGSIVSPDGASSNSDGPFSGADAAVMAEAFRKALRKPDFADRPVEEGESPDTLPNKETELMNRELAEEGRDIRSVGSSRGVRMETLGDASSPTQT
ncbi:hypothetical protein BD410DRAFT_839087 [Rickenella mellea]|uniref:Uncharacterized protein n=1 Tax=Rickenella mellea TaxID=50990 RepID=A0A4Y7Q7J5_9AGAM|nr:hypothetical protein BD410DRAFT_839087 [Rickenella mellea]